MSKKVTVRKKIPAVRPDFTISGDVPELFREKVYPNLDLISAWLRDGLSNQQIAENLKVSYKTLERYRQQIPEFGEMWKREKYRLDFVHMVNAYQMRAEGYTTVEVEREYKVDERGNRTLVKERERERHVPADPRALENWIQLRLKDDPTWGRLREIIHDKDIEIGGEGGLVFIPAKKALEVLESEGKEVGNSMDAPTETT